MKNRVLTVGIVLALIIAIAIPATVFANGTNTDTTEITGSIVEAEITVTAPGDIAFGMFHVGNNTQHASDGTLTITFNSRGGSWQVTAKDESANDGYMMQADNTTALNSKVLISKDGSTYATADVGLNYTGTGNSSLPFWATQNIVGNETVGNYSITITFTGGLALPD